MSLRRVAIVSVALIAVAVAAFLAAIAWIVGDEQLWARSGDA